jgi:glycosidase
MDFILRKEDSVIRHWLRCGASGYRLDVVDELPDVFLDALRIAVKSVNDDAAIIGEVWEDASTKISYGQKRRYLDGRQLDSVMNYPLRTGILDFLKGRNKGTEFAAIIDQLKSNYPETVFYGLMNFLSTHDTPRILTVLSEDETQEEGRQILYLALLLWAFLPGIPCIYYGDEIGMTGGKDPFNRMCFQPELADRTIQGFYKRILAFRKATESLEEYVPQSYRSGNANDGFFSFHREGSHCRILAGVNAGDEPVFLPLDLREGETISDFIICGDVSFSDLTTYRLGRRSGIVVRIE